MNYTLHTMLAESLTYLSKTHVTVDISDMTRELDKFILSFKFKILSKDFTYACNIFENSIYDSKFCEKLHALVLELEKVMTSTITNSFQLCIEIRYVLCKIVKQLLNVINDINDNHIEMYNIVQNLN